MPIPFTFDTPATLDWFVTLSLDNVPWLTQIINTVVTENCFAGDPGLVYPGPKPYLVWTPPRISISHGNAGEVGSVKGDPNTYVGSYREDPYETGGDVTLETQRRVWTTYNLIAKALVKPDGDDNCPPQGVEIMAVYMEHAVDAMYIQTGNGPMIGCLIVVRVREVYNDG